MAYENKPGQGGLFIAEKKSDKAPDRTGKLVCPCCKTELRLAGWGKQSAGGAKWLSLKAEFDEITTVPAVATPAAPTEFNDDIPF